MRNGQGKGLELVMETTCVFLYGCGISAVLGSFDSLSFLAIS